MKTNTSMSMETTVNMSMPMSWHEQCEWENAVSYEQGYRAGYADCERQIATEICVALGRPAADSKAVIRWLVRTTGIATTTTITTTNVTAPQPGRTA